jgi:outer membrane receptor protein involved in Fe transport
MSNWNRFTGSVALAALAAAMVAPAAIYAQETAGSLRGVVSGPDGAISNANIVIVHVPTGGRTTIKTDAAGQFNAGGLRVGGPYSIEVTADGFRGTSIPDATVSLSDEGSLAIVLEAEGRIVERVVVSATRLRARQGTGPETTLNAFRIDGVASISGDVRDIARRNPLVSIDATNENAFSVAGTNPRLNSLTVDGVRLNDDFGLNSGGLPTSRGPISVDAIQEVSVSIAPYSVVNGSFQGGLVNIVTRSGGNEFEGAIYGKITTPELASKRVYNTVAEKAGRLNPDGTPGWVSPLVPLESRTLGFRLGGPIIKDKLFFFVSYEDFVGDVPNSTGTSDSNLLNRVPGVTSAEVEQVRSIMRTTYGYDALTVPPSAVEETDKKLLARIDWNITDGHRFQLTYNKVTEDSPRRGSNTNHNANNNNLSLYSNFYRLGQYPETWTGQLFSRWNDNLTTEFRVSTKAYGRDQESYGGSQRDPNQFGQFIVCTRPTVQTPTTTNCSGEGQLYVGPDNSRHANELANDTLQYNGRVDWRIGNHRLTFGASREELEVANRFIQNSEGNFTFLSLADLQNRRAFQVVYQNGISADGTKIGEDQADALFGYATNSIFAEDNWDILPNLKLNFGLRYDFFETTSGQIRDNAAFRTRVGFANTATVDGTNLLQPRFGASWKPLDWLTVRGGLGRFGGGTPSVWISNTYANDGVGVSTITLNRNVPTSINNAAPTCRGSATLALAQSCHAAVVASILDGGSSTTWGRDLPAALNTQILAARGTNANTVALDPNFKVPSVDKSNLGFDARVPLMGTMFNISLEGLFQKFDNPISYRNARLVRTKNADGSLRTFFDGRPVYNPETGQDFITGNSTENPESSSVTFSVGTRYDMGLDWNWSYTVTEAEDTNPLVSSVAFSNYNGVAVFDGDNPGVARGNNAVKWETKFEANFNRKLIGDLESRFTLFANLRAGRPFSYVFNDGNAGFATGIMPTGTGNRALLYVPDFNLTPTTTGTGCAPATPCLGRIQFDSLATLNAMKAFVQGGDLAGYQGKVAPRNEFDLPSIAQFDLRYSQDIPTPIKGHKFKLIVDMENIGNMINPRWGLIEATGFPSVYQLVNAAPVNFGNDAAGNPILGYRYSGFTSVRNEICPTVSCDQKGFWKIAVGFRYEF